MKVKAKQTVHDHIVDDCDHKRLSPGHIYVVIEINEGDFRVINDRGEPILYPKGLFEIIDCSIPSGWVFLDEGDGAYSIGPPDCSYPGFYERYFDKEPNAVAKFEVLRKISETW
jgi:hypothetical protein